jgi:7-cyano-7-deazaguanine synthase
MNVKAQSVVVLSGGMDSTVCAALSLREHGAEGTAALHISYGQRTEQREQQAFSAICDRLGIHTRLMFRTPFFHAIGGSALTYVPFRNAHFLSAATSWAEVLGARSIYIGAVQQDSSGYPDCRPEFYQAFNQAIRTGTKDGAIQIETPLIGLRKSQIVTLGLELGAPFDLTWSCYSRVDQACGVCESCVLRLRAFAAAGAHDPIAYLSSTAVPE